MGIRGVFFYKIRRDIRARGNEIGFTANFGKGSVPRLYYPDIVITNHFVFIENIRKDKFHAINYPFIFCFYLVCFTDDSGNYNI
jgi:hypothetical protein